MPNQAILERIADSPTAAWAFDQMAKVSTPASITYAVGTLAKFVADAPKIPEDMSIVEGFVQVANTAIGSLSTVIGSAGVVLSVYMAGQWRRFRAETERIKGEQDHQYRMAQLRTGEMERIAPEASSRFALDPRCAKPDDDTVDVK